MNNKDDEDMTTTQQELNMASVLMDEIYDSMSRDSLAVSIANGELINQYDTELPFFRPYLSPSTISKFARSRDTHHEVVYILFGEPLKTFVEENVNFEDYGELSFNFLLAADSFAYYVSISHYSLVS